MADTIEVYVNHGSEALLVGRCRYLAKRRGQSSVFEYSDTWLDHPDAFALDPANLPRGRQPFYTRSDRSALPGALRDSAPDRWGQHLIRRAFRKAGDERTLTEIDYVFNILIGNLDDHLRNHGFLYDRSDQWRLSPAYDLNPVPRQEKARELTTWISEEGPAADLDLARHAASSFALKPDEAEAVIEEMSGQLEVWQDTARQLGMSDADVDTYATAFSI